MALDARFVCLFGEAVSFRFGSLECLSETVVISSVTEACRACDKIDGANAVVVSGTHTISRDSLVCDIPIVDATLAGLYSLEGRFLERH